MVCPKCGAGMEEMKRSYHKKRKWVCRVCGRVRMETPKDGRRRKSGKDATAVE